MHQPMSTVARAKPDRPWALWLALLLTVFGALAPTVSHALNWARDDRPGMVLVCTSSGPRWMALGQLQDSATFSDPRSSPTDAPEAPAQSFDHCPFCLLLADRAAPPPQPWLTTFALPGQAVAPAISPTGFLPTFTAPKPHSRAPPDLI